MNPVLGLVLWHNGLILCLLSNRIYMGGSSSLATPLPYQQWPGKAIENSSEAYGPGPIREGSTEEASGTLLQTSTALSVADV